jgi:hypothetical protein
MTEANHDNVTLLAMPIGEGVELRVTKGEFRGQRHVDIRRYWNSPEGWVPTRKGVSFSPADVPRILDALLLAIAGAEDPALEELRRRSGTALGTNR